MYSFIVPHSWKKNFSKKTLPVKFLFIHFVSKREKEALSSSKSTTLSASSSCCLIILSWEANVHESQSTTVKVWGVKSASSIWSVSLQLFVDFLLFIFSICLLLLPMISILCYCLILDTCFDPFYFITSVNCSNIPNNLDFLIKRTMYNLNLPLLPVTIELSFFF